MSSAFYRFSNSIFSTHWISILKMCTQNLIILGKKVIVKCHKCHFKKKNLWPESLNSTKNVSSSRKWQQINVISPSRYDSMGIITSKSHLTLCDSSVKDSTWLGEILAKLHLGRCVWLMWSSQINFFGAILLIESE